MPVPMPDLATPLDVQATSYLAAADSMLSLLIVVSVTIIILPSLIENKVSSIDCKHMF